MKLKIFIAVIVLTLIYSCSTDDASEDLIVEEEVFNTVDIRINGAPPENEIRNISAAFCFENEINAGFDYFTNAEEGGTGGDGLDVTLDKNGNLIGLRYITYNPYNTYTAAFFSPAATIDIVDFEFIPGEILKFKISGQIFKRTNGFNDVPVTLNIEAAIEIRKFTTCNCDSFQSNIISNNEFNFHGLSRSETGAILRYYAATNNGYQIEFNNFNEYFKNMPLSVYSFDENSSSQRIDLRKFIGVPRAFTNFFIPEEWLVYNTSGDFEILERRQTSNGQTVTKVLFNFVAKENNTVIHEFNDAVLETSF